MSHKASSSKRVGRTTEAFRAVVDDSQLRVSAAMDALDLLDSIDAFDALLPPSDAPDGQPADSTRADEAPVSTHLASVTDKAEEVFSHDSLALNPEQPIDSDLSTKLFIEPHSAISAIDHAATDHPCQARNDHRANQSPSGDCEAIAIADATMDHLPQSGDNRALQIDSLRQWEADLRQLQARLQGDELDLSARRRELAKQVRLQRRTPQRSDSASTDLRLAELQAQFEMLVLLLREAWPSGEVALTESPEPAVGNDSDRGSAADNLSLTAPSEKSDAEATLRIRTLEQRIESLVEQNDQLASELAHLAVQRTVDQSSDASASLSWEERKALLYRQFESEECANIAAGEPGSNQVECELRHELACMQHELLSRDAEIKELRTLLEQRPQVQGSELAFGAAAITRLFDDDELIREERLRLKEIQAEWEIKFRDMEIAASIERANLARERRQLECQNAELEEQLAHLKQELRQESIAGPTQNRRWFAKLGLGE